MEILRREIYSSSIFQREVILFINLYLDNILKKGNGHYSLLMLSFWIDIFGLSEIEMTVTAS